MPKLLAKSTIRGYRSCVDSSILRIKAIRIIGDTYWLECSYGKIFIPVTKFSVAKTEISVTGRTQLLI